MESLDTRKTPRYLLAIDVEAVDVQSGTRISAQTKSLSKAGCGVESAQLLRQGSNVSLKFTHRGEEVRAFARVVYSRSEVGMGFALTFIEAEDERILEDWISECLILPLHQK